MPPRTAPCFGGNQKPGQMLRAVALVTLTALVLAGCGRGDRLRPLNQGPAAPGGVQAARDVDPLTVGHRLMAAGETELALKQFYRAAGEEGMTADVLSAIGSANLRLGRLGQAEDALRRAIKEDEKYAAAWNNLGVVLMEQGKVGEASRVFQTAFALDSGESVEIRENLQRAMSRLENPAYTQEKRPDFDLVRAGSGEWQLLSTP